MKIQKKTYIISFMVTGLALFFLMLLVGFSNMSEREITFFAVIWIILSLGIAAYATYTEERVKDLNIKSKTSNKKELQHTTSHKKAYRNCPRCGHAITFEENVCPYCERTIR